MLVCETSWQTRWPWTTGELGGRPVGEGGEAPTVVTVQPLQPGCCRQSLQQALACSHARQLCRHEWSLSSG